MNSAMHIDGRKLVAADWSSGPEVTDIFLLSLLAVMLFYPLMSVGFTTSDDADTAINFGWTTGLFDTAKIHAQNQGRFGFLWGYPLLRVPFLIENRGWYLICTFGAFAVLLSTLHFALMKIFSSKWLAFASLAFFLTFVQNGWDHNALTSYPFAFNMYASMFVGSLAVFTIAIDQRKKLLLWLSALLYLLSLAIELFVLFFPFFIGIFIHRRIAAGKGNASLPTGKSYLLVPLFTLCLYLAVYVLWRHVHPSQYDGNSLNKLDILAAVKTIFTYSINAFPIASIKFLAHPEARVSLVNDPGLRNMMAELTLTNYIRPAVSSFVFFRILSAKSIPMLTTKTFFISALFAIAGIFFPNILLGFIKKHQDWVAAGSTSYLYTYYSFISATFLAALSLVYLNQRSASWNARRRLVYVTMAVTTILITAFAVEMRNSRFLIDQKLSAKKWKLMEIVTNSADFRTIPNSSIIVAPTLTENQRGIVHAPGNYWQRYIQFKTRKQVRFDDESCHGSPSCYSIVFRQERHSDGQYAILSKIDNPVHMSTYEVIVYSIRDKPVAQVSGTIRIRQEPMRLQQNGIPIFNIDQNSFTFPMDGPIGSHNLQVARLVGNVEIFPEQISVSTSEVEPRLQPLEAKLGQGFYKTEFATGRKPWAWSDGHSSIWMINHGQEDVRAIVQFDVTSVEALGLNIPEVFKSPIEIQPDNIKSIQFEISVKPGKTKIDLLSDRPPIRPRNGDQRFLSFSVSNLNVVQKHLLN